MAEQTTVLIVDDDVDLAEMTCELIEMAGLQAIYRTSVTDAVDYLARHSGTTVGLLTDINLSAPMSGIELAELVAAQWPDMAICVTSGFTNARPKRLPAGAAFLAKPWHTPDLMAFIATAARR